MIPEKIFKYTNKKKYFFVNMFTNSQRIWSALDESSSEPLSFLKNIEICKSYSSFCTNYPYFPCGRYMFGDLKKYFLVIIFSKTQRIWTQLGESSSEPLSFWKNIEICKSYSTFCTKYPIFSMWAVYSAHRTQTVKA